MSACRLVVETGKLCNNFRIIKEKAGSAQVIAVLKGDAYGLGLVPVAQILAKEGAEAFAVTEPDDLTALRRAGVTQDVLILRSTAIFEEALEIAREGGIAVIGSFEAAMAAQAASESACVPVRVHAEIDSGMGRYGFSLCDIDQLIHAIKEHPGLKLEGLFTHPNRAFGKEKYVRAALDVLKRAADALSAAGIEPGCLHMANSPGLMRFDYTRLDAVRIGSALTGRLVISGDFGLERVGYARCPIVEVRSLAKGDTVGYGAAFRARRPMRAAIIPLGYADGFCTAKSKDTFGAMDTARTVYHAAKDCIGRKRMVVSINGHTATVIGHVGMLHTVADVTDIECRPGDFARFEVNPIIAGRMMEKVYE